MGVYIPPDFFDVGARKNGVCISPENYGKVPGVAQLGQVHYSGGRLHHPAAAQAVLLLQDAGERFQRQRGELEPEEKEEHGALGDSPGCCQAQCGEEHQRYHGEELEDLRVLRYVRGHPEELCQKALNAGFHPLPPPPFSPVSRLPPIRGG
eukprot:gene7717-biopygen6072